MLSIKRVPTVVSNYQNNEAEEDAAGGCGRNCLKSCCIQGARLPLYAFKKRAEKVGGKELPLLRCKQQCPVAFLDSLILGEWEDRVQRGLFRYDVTACETKVIPGNYGFIAQLNEGRHLKKRPTEFCVDKVLQPFDESKFNFTKVGQEEVLFQFEASNDGEVQFSPNVPIDVENSPSFVAINVSPIEYGHVLLIPRIFECLPQRIDHESFLLALHMAVEARNPYFRLGYNSLGAFATINHLHFQAYYLALPFPIEKAPTKTIAKLSSSVKISKLLNYPVRGLVFEGGHTLEDLANAVSEACICLQHDNIPYNVLISDCGRQVFLLPQCYAEKQALGEVGAELLETQVNPAVWEISGHMVLKRKKDYDEASEANAWRLLAEVSLSEERFQEVTSLVFRAIESVEMNVKPQQRLEEVDGVSSSTQPVMVAGSQQCLVLQLAEWCLFGLRGLCKNFSGVLN
ncbi:GDP-L-galactose phosphorylase 1, partial [Mucuna pruriens]